LLEPLRERRRRPRHLGAGPAGPMGAAARPARPLRAALGGFGLGPLRATGGGGAAVRAAGPVRPAALGGLRLGPLCAGPAELVTRSRLRRPGVGPLWRARRRP